MNDTKGKITFDINQCRTQRTGAKPSRFNLLRYLYPFMFKLPGPFALDIWNESIEQWLPKDFIPAEITKETRLGGLNQEVIIHKF